MSRRIIVFILLSLASFSQSGCLYRGGGIFNQINNSDYKARFSLMNLFVAADGRPTYVFGSVLLEDKITPLKAVYIVLQKDEKVVASAHTDHIGMFTLSAILPDDAYVLEVASPEYECSKDVIVKLNKSNDFELIAHKKP